MDGAPCYDEPVKRTQKATKAASAARTLRRLRRMAEELREAGWTVEEPK